MHTSEPYQNVALFQEEPPTNTCSVEVKLTLRQRIGRKLFPSRHVDWPDMTHNKDGICTNTHAELSFKDRIRVLISGRLTVVNRTGCENGVGHTVTTCCLHVDPPAFLA